MRLFSPKMFKIIDSVRPDALEFFLRNGTIRRKEWIYLIIVIVLRKYHFIFTTSQ